MDRYAKRALQRLPEKVTTAAIEFICGPLATNPRRVGKALRLDLEGAVQRTPWRLPEHLPDR